jgi:hypothetical protein
VWNTHNLVQVHQVEACCDTAADLKRPQKPCKPPKMTVTLSEQPAWPDGDPGKVLLNCIISTDVDEVFEELFGSYPQTQVCCTVHHVPSRVFSFNAWTLSRQWEAQVLLHSVGQGVHSHTVQVALCMPSCRGSQRPHNVTAQSQDANPFTTCLVHAALCLQAKLHKQRNDSNCAESPWVSQRSQLPAQQFVWPAPPAGADPGTAAQGSWRKVRLTIAALCPSMQTPTANVWFQLVA